MTGTVSAFRDLDSAGIDAIRINDREPIPRLVDLLEAFPTARFNIDVKSDDAVDPTLAVLRAADALDRVCVASFSGDRLRRIELPPPPRRPASLPPRSPRCASTRPGTDRPAGFAAAVRASRCRRGADVSPWSRPDSSSGLTRSASPCTCGPSMNPARCDICSTSVSTASCPTGSTCCVTCTPNEASGGRRERERRGRALHRTSAGARMEPVGLGIGRLQRGDRLLRFSVYLTDSVGDDLPGRASASSWLGWSWGSVASQSRSSRPSRVSGATRQDTGDGRSACSPWPSSPARR